MTHLPFWQTNPVFTMPTFLIQPIQIFSPDAIKGLVLAVFAAFATYRLTAIQFESKRIVLNKTNEYRTGDWIDT